MTNNEASGFISDYFYFFIALSILFPELWIGPKDSAKQITGVEITLSKGILSEVLQR
jgi:hypothetical protein